MSSAQDMRRQPGQDKAMKKAPANFEEDDDNIGDVEENAMNRGGRGGNTGNYQTADTQNRGMQIDQRGTQRKRRPSSGKRKRSAGKKGNQMANKSYASSEIGGDESHHHQDPENSKDFNSAYQKLVEKIYQEQGNTLLISQDEVFKLEHSKNLSLDDFRARQEEYMSQKQRKLDEKLDQVKDKDLEGCTFAPQLVTSQDTSQRRNLDQFLQDQQKFIEKVNKKVHDIKESTVHEEISIMHPTIDETSKRIVEEKFADRKSKATHERLYDLNKERQLKLKVKQDEERDKFKLQSVEHMNSVQSTSRRERDKPLDQTLYEDAERRRNDHVKLKQEADRMRDKPKQERFHNENSDKYVINRFYREIDLIEQDYQLQAQNRPPITDEEEDGEGGINFHKLIQILHMLGFLPNTEQAHAIDQQLCQDLWALVRGDSRNGVTFDTLRVVFLNFIGVKTLDREGDAPEEENENNGEEAADRPNEEITKLGFFQEGQFFLRRGVHQTLFTHFKNFYIHRVQFVGSVQRRPTTYQPISEQNAEKKPYISNKSSKMADNKRKKLLGDRENVNLVEILLIPKHNESYLEEQRKQLKDREVEGCTFAPKTLDYQMTSQRETHGDKCIDLYSSKPRGWFKEKEFKTAEAYDFEKSKEVCTFRPQINDPSALASLNDDQNIDQIRGVDKVFDRMTKARQDKMQKKLMTERGMPNQLIAALGKPEPSMSFSSNKSKFKSAFGVDGSQIQPKKRNLNESQRIERSQMSNRPIAQPKRNPPPRQQQIEQPKPQVQQKKPQTSQQQRNNPQYSNEEPVNIKGQNQPDRYQYEEEDQPQYEREGMNETDYDGQQYQNDDSDQQSPVKSQNDREPMLYVDVNLGNSGTQRIVVFEGDTAEGLAEKFSVEYNLDASMKEKLTQMLQTQIAGVLEKIDEEQVSNNSDQPNQD